MNIMVVSGLINDVPDELPYEIVVSITDYSSGHLCRMQFRKDGPRMVAWAATWWRGQCGPHDLMAK